MLRDVKIDYVRSRMIGGAFTSTTTPSITADYGQDGTLLRNSAGRSQITLSQPFGQMCIAIAQQHTLSGGFESQAAVPTNAGILQFDSRDNGTTFTDARVDWLALGYDQNLLPYKIPNQKVKATLRKSILVGGQIAGATATVNIGKKDFSITRASAGRYTINFLRPFAQPPLIFFNFIATSGYRTLKVTARTGSSCTVECDDNTPAAQDATFNIMVYGTMCKDQHGKARSNLCNTQRKPRLLAGAITVSGGVPAFTTIVSGKATGFNDIFTNLVDQGAGDVSFDFVKPFKREPIIINTPVSSVKTRLHTITSTGVRIQNINTAATPSDPVGYHFLILGSDEVNQY